MSAIGARALLCSLALALVAICEPARAITFSSTAQTAPTGDNPQSVASADFDRDGLPDLATADVNSDRVTVVRNAGDGTFSTLATPATGDGPQSVAAADFDRDGLPDLATSDQSSNRVTVLRNDGDGTFSTLATPATGSRPFSVAVGDFDRDGLPDLATADFGFNRVTVLRNDGDGTFSTLATPATGRNPESLAVADFDRDGLPDLATADVGSNRVTVLRNDGDGTFSTLANPATSSSPVSVAVADLNRDGLPDLATADAGSNRLTVLRNNGDGTFSTLATPATGLNPHSVAVADFDRDGLPDLANADSASNRVNVLRNNGDWTFSGVATPATGNFPLSLAIADFNRDGRPDLANADRDADRVRVRLNTTQIRRTNAFIPLATPATGPGSAPRDLGVGDFDRDGHPDIATADQGADQVTVLLADGAGGFVAQPVHPPTGGGPSSIALGDFDRDGRADLVTADFGNNTLTVLLADGDGTFSLSDTLDAGMNPQSVAVGDFDRDGRPDVAAAARSSLWVSWFLGDGDGMFGDRDEELLGAEANPVAAAVGDFNRDGNPDLAAAEAGGRVVILLGDGTGAFTVQSVRPPTGAGPAALAVGDFNRDGNPDLATANFDDNTVTVLLGSGDGTFTPLPDQPVGTGPASLAADDFNRDGKPDLATADFASKQATVLLGNGDGTFTTLAHHPSTGTDPLAIAAGDFDRDGRADLATADRGANSLSVLRAVYLEVTLSPPDALAFGDVDVDDGPATRTVTVTNTGDDPNTLQTIGLAGSGEFELVTSGTDDCTTTTPLEAGDACDVRVRFDPATTGAKSATLTVTAQEPQAQSVVTLTGRGTQTELSRSPATLPFGNQDIDDGPTATQSTTLTNTGTEPVAISGAAFGGTGAAAFARATGNLDDCSATPLNAGDTCDVRVHFDPTVTGLHTATLTVTSNAADVTVTLTGSGTQTELSRAPATLVFGDQDIGDGASAAQTATVTNSGTETVTITAITLAGANPAAFTRLTGGGMDCTTTTALDAGDTCDLRATFDPTTTGPRAATITVVSNAAEIIVDLTGSGTQTELSRSPATLPFGDQDIDDGATTARTATVTNTGTEPVAITAIRLGGAGPAAFTRLTSNGIDCATTTLNAGDTCDLRATFDPTTTGPHAATITVTSNVGDITVTLTGSGVQTELSLAPATLPFGEQDIDDGATAAQTSTLTNSGTEPVTLTAVTRGGGDAAHFEPLTGNLTDCAAATTLAAAQTCTLRARFDPASTGAKAAAMTVASNAADIAVTLTGTGTQTELSRAPAALTFAAQNVADGPAATRASTVINSGTQPVTLTAVTLAGEDASEFKRPADVVTDCAAGALLTAGHTCALRATFDPSSPGPKDATLTVTSNAATTAVALAGTATQNPMCEGRVATIVARPGRHKLIGTPRADVIIATDKADTIDGRGGNDTICAGAGRDTIVGGTGNDLIRGGAGRDRINGGSGNDVLLGGAGNDDLRGQAGSDRLGGGTGADRVDGGAGNDLLDDRKLGGYGQDHLLGGSGSDRVRTAGSTTDDVDCGPGTDSITLDLKDRQRHCERVTRVHE